MTEVVFLNKSWMWPILFGAFLLLLLFCWKEWAQPVRQRFGLKLLLSVLAIGSLVFLALKPAIQVPYEAEKAIVITEGYNQAQLDSIQEKFPGIEVEQYIPGRPLKQEMRSRREVIVLGRGLKAFDLWQLEEVPVEYLGGNVPTGVVKTDYSLENSVGDQWEFKGNYVNPNQGNRLVLEGPGGAALDSVSLRGGESQYFELSTELLVEGNFLFSLVEKDSLGGIVGKEPVPLKVSPKRTLKVLMVNAFPSFETKYLKNYLAEAGHEVVVRSQITRGRYKYEFFNTERVPVGTLDEERLEAFDLLVLDGNAIKGLSGGTINSIANSSKNNGLGILIQPEQNYFNSGNALSSFRFVREGSKEVNQNGTSVPKRTFAFVDEPTLEVIHDSDSGILSAYKRQGAGRIGTTVFENTYQLVLRGNSDVYEKIWSDILEQLAKKPGKEAEWEPKSRIAFADRPFRFKLRTGVRNPMVQNDQGTLIPLKRNVELRNMWEGITWPLNAGWQRQVLNADSTLTFDYYVADTSQWKALLAQQTITENSRFFDDRKLKKESLFSLEAVNPLWFFVVFLFSMGYLWFEPKYFG